MITSRQRKYLRSHANDLRPLLQIGKSGINPNLVKQLDDALEARELVKASVLQSAPDSVEEISRRLSEMTGSELVQVIGNKFVVYRESRDSKTIVLPD
ncbi:MAG: ribosome assembly RNA-binding protein YhbY [Eubacteriales bacterium]|nr:ribosome assembly RNA-binding protein YhbY [Eubacteriales bacterium]